MENLACFEKSNNFNEAVLIRSGNAYSPKSMWIQADHTYNNHTGMKTFIFKSYEINLIKFRLAF